MGPCWPQKWMTAGCGDYHMKSFIFASDKFYLKIVLYTAYFQPNLGITSYSFLCYMRLYKALLICLKTGQAYVRLQNLPWSKTGLVSRQVLHPLSKLQNWIRSKTGRYKTGLVSNTKIEASLRGTKHKPWQSNLTSDTVEIFIQDQFSSQTGFASYIEATKLD